MRLSLCLLLLLLPTVLLADAPPPATKPTDPRLTTVRTRGTNDISKGPNAMDFMLSVPPTLEAWKARQQAVRVQMLVANGLWPMWPKTPFVPVIHGRIEREGYTVEKVYFASLPGHYVTGNLYRPTGVKGKRPAVLCPHGHWKDGRLFDAGAKTKAGNGEKTAEGARYPLQARCAQLARMGCVVFFYDMVGYADSTAIDHSGFRDAEAALRLQNLVGLQTWTSIRALDFLIGLPEVDPARIGVTGASGGGTQTFLLGAVDDRPAAAFPAVMVSANMQGGCVCENTPYLRQGTGNIEISALFAPRPLAMSGAGGDWTHDVERRGLPELKRVYALYGAEDKVLARTWKEFGHNYNQVSREMMYEWFNDHLKLGHAKPIAERAFVPVPPAELRVFDKAHPRPADSARAAEVRAYLTKVADKQRAEWLPKDEAGRKKLPEVVRPALRVMAHSDLPGKERAEAAEGSKAVAGASASWQTILLGRRGTKEQVPATWALPKDWKGTTVVWVHPKGRAGLWQDGKLVTPFKALLDANVAILAPDCFNTGDLALPKPRNIDIPHTLTFNRPMVSERVHDILTTVGYARTRPGTKAVHLVGVEESGPWVLLARALCGDSVARTVADANRFRFESVREANDPMLLPGALKYGGLPAFTALIAPGELFVYNHRGTGMGEWLNAAYAANKERVRLSGEAVEAAEVARWLLR